MVSMKIYWDLSLRAAMIICFPAGGARCVFSPVFTFIYLSISALQPLQEYTGTARSSPVVSSGGERSGEGIDKLVGINITQQPTHTYHFYYNIFSDDDHLYLIYFRTQNGVIKDSIILTYPFFSCMYVCMCVCVDVTEWAFLSTYKNNNNEASGISYLFVFFTLFFCFFYVYADLKK